MTRQKDSQCNVCPLKGTDRHLPWTVRRKRTENEEMKLSHLKKTQRDDGSHYLAGTSRYAIPANTLVMLKKCPDHDACYVLWTLEPRQPRTDVDPGVFDGITLYNVRAT